MQGRPEPRGAQAVRFQCRRIIPYRPRFVRNCAAMHLAGTPCGQSRAARNAMPASQAAAFRTRLRNAAGPGRSRRARVDRAACGSRACPYRRGHGARGTRIVGRPKALDDGGWRSERSGNRNAAVWCAPRLPQGPAAAPVSRQPLTPNGNATRQPMAGPAAGVRCPRPPPSPEPTVPVPFSWRCKTDRNRSFALCRARSSAACAARVALGRHRRRAQTDQGDSLRHGPSRVHSIRAHASWQARTPNGSSGCSVQRR